MLKEQVKKEEDELKKQFIEKEAKLVSKLIVWSVFCNWFCKSVLKRGFFYLECSPNILIFV